MHLASLRGNHEIVRYLISEYAADVTKRDKNGANALDLAIKKNQLRCEWVIRQLTSNGLIDLIKKMGVERLRDKRF